MFKTGMILFAGLAIAGQGALVGQGPPISIEGKAIELLGENAQLSRFSKVARLTLTIRNNTSETISAWRVRAHFTDPFGENMFEIQLTAGTANIPPGGTVDAHFNFEDNKFIEREPFDHLASYAADKIGIRFDSIRVVN